MSDRVKGRSRLPTDGLRNRDPETDKERLREAQQQVAEEAAKQRDERQTKSSVGDLPERGISGW